MTAEQVDFGDGTSAAGAGARLGWQAPLVLLLALLVVLGAGAGGVALGRQEPAASSAATGPLDPYATWSDLMSALSDPAVPPAGSSPEVVLDATRSYFDRVREPSQRFHAALDADDGPYDFDEFPTGSPTRASLVALDGAISRYVVAVDAAVEATDQCIEGGRAAQDCVAEQLGADTTSLRDASTEVESAYRTVVTQAVVPSDFLG